MATRRILIVSDETSVARELEATLAGCGYHVAAVGSSGRRAITSTGQQEPDLVLMDMALAGEMEERFFAVSIDMLCCLGFNGYFKRLNPAWERTLGFTLEELTSRPFIEFVHPDDRERTLKQNGQVRGGGKALGFENRYLCKDGSYRWLLWNAAPDFEGKVIYSVARDITARKEAEDERELLVRELQAALAEVRTLQEILPICSYCKKIRDDENYWQSVDGYISQRTNTRFSHSICPTCFETEVEA
jgi:PAS domain S-box-containing protein